MGSRLPAACEHRYLVFVPGSGTWPGALGDFIASASNFENSSWLDSADPSQLELVVLDWFKGWIGFPTEAAPGKLIVRRWASSREFYVILAGTAEARTAEEHLAHLGPGVFFGELAALDWGVSFGYPRLASVTATSPARLLVLPGTRFTILVRDAAGFGDRIRRAVRERLPGL
jgi:hypothetical protein